MIDSIIPINSIISELKSKKCLNFKYSISNENNAIKILFTDIFVEDISEIEDFFIAVFGKSSEFDILIDDNNKYILKIALEVTVNNSSFNIFGTISEELRIIRYLRRKSEISTEEIKELVIPNVEKFYNFIDNSLRECCDLLFSVEDDYFYLPVMQNDFIFNKLGEYSLNIFIRNKNAKTREIKKSVLEPIYYILRFVDMEISENNNMLTIMFKISKDKIIKNIVPN